MSTSMNTQPEPLPQPSPILWGNKICMSILDTSHKKIAITPRDNYYDQLTLIRINKNKQVRNKDGNIKYKNPKESNFK